MTAPALVDMHGRPLRAAADRFAPASIYGRTAYEAASYGHKDMSDWLPRNISGQSALSVERDLMSDRVSDIARNDGWGSASLSRQLDLVIGAGWRPSVDLPAATLGLDPDEADELGDMIEEAFTDWGNDPAFLCDATRQGPMARVLGLAYRHRIADGEALAELCWEEGRGPYATFVKIIDPDRLSNPFDQADTSTRRAGVELDVHGAAIGYHIRSGHPDDDYLWGSGAPEWVLVPRETEWGRPVMLHAFEAESAGQFRGVPPLAPILRKLKQMVRYDEAELQAAMVNAVLAAFITSPGDHDALAEALSSDNGRDQLSALAADRLKAYREAPPRIASGTAHFLYPGDQVTLSQPGHPNSGFEAFFRAALRNVASTVGLSYEQLTMDWSQVNYSSARAALLEVWRGLTARKSMFAAQFMNRIWWAWLEEAIDRGIVRLPAAAPSFHANPAAWCRVDWIGPARGWVDPQKEADAAATRLDIGISTMERECAEQGLDWKQVVRRRGREKRFLAANGLATEVNVPARRPGPPDDPETGEPKDDRPKAATRRSIVPSIRRAA